MSKRKAMTFTRALFTATLLLGSAAAAAEGEPLGVTFGPYYRISVPLAGEEANPSWAGGAFRLRYEWTDELAISGAFTYDRYEFDEKIMPAVVGVSDLLERQIFALRGGVIYNLPLEWTYPYAGGGLALAREKAVYRRYADPLVRWHPALYGEAGTYIPLVGPLVIDVGADFTVLLGKRAGDYDRDAGGYQDTGGAALYLGLQAGVGLFL
ncbi:MAG: hypothetical protein JSU81_09885 [Candidatus Coatesbacteria bacterium]|nr:MAG: hypothetical protein JSU81_09885 [Candidatus Coatesbacteria bacterium]